MLKASKFKRDRRGWAEELRYRGELEVRINRRKEVKAKQIGQRELQKRVD